jgi:hypothetical protein
VDRHSAEPEELAPLELRELRRLDVERPAGDQAPAYIAAASGVVRRGDFLYVIGDDELDLAVFRLSAGGPGELRPVFDGDLPDDPAERKRAKADVEALTALPPFEGARHGGLFGLGSGSKSTRNRGFFWALDSDGSLMGDPHTVDLDPVYDLLRQQFPKLNIEGASVLAERLWLFHRGNRDAGPNAVAEFRLDAVMESLGGDWRIDVSELEAVREYELGELGGVRLCFSDATPLADELVVFTASAEMDAGGDADGGIKGSVVGTISAAGEVERLRAIDPRWKVEGVHAAIDTGVIDFTFVCDQDDPAVASPLLSATMPVEGRLEVHQAV